MACGNCSCGHNHDDGHGDKGGKRTWTAVFGGVALGALVLIGAAAALQPQDKPKTDPTKPATTTPATPSAPSTPAGTPPATTPAKPEGKKPEQPGKEKDEQMEAATFSPYVLGFTMKTIDGKEQKLEEYKGKVVLIVNVASKCGNTPQYAGLQKLYEEKKDKGLVILGFPANDFMSQEPGSNSEIAAFCTSKYHVTFPMFEKIRVKGEGAHPLYKQLAAQPKPLGGEPDWNFAKYLVDRSGNVVAHYTARTKPDDAEMGKKIEELLGKGAGSEKK